VQGAFPHRLDQTIVEFDAGIFVTGCKRNLHHLTGPMYGYLITACYSPHCGIWDL